MLRDLRPILRLFLADRVRLAAGIGLAAATALAGLALLGLSGWFITATALAGASVATGLAFDVFAPAAAIRFLALARTAGRYGERLVSHDATLRILAELRERLFRGWAVPDAAGRLRLRPARLLFRLTLDTDALDGLYLRVLVPGLTALTTGGTAAIALGILDPMLGLAAGGALLGLGLALPVAASRSARRAAMARTHGLERLRAGTIDLVTGQRELVMAGQVGTRQEGLARIDARIAASDRRLDRIETGMGAGLGILGAALVAGTLLAVAALVRDGTIGVPESALALMLALFAVEPFATLGRAASELGRSLLAARRLAPRLAPAVSREPRRAPTSGLAVDIVATTVRHPDAHAPALRDVTLSLAVGERVALVGPSGAGKSTLLSLVAEEVSPGSGSVAAIPATLMTQRTELFRDSLRDNLRLADPAADDARLLDALSAAGLDDLIRGLPRGLETRLGDGGFGLSGGQARRLALARLFLRDSGLWLLDEPTEGLDGATARDVLARLWERGTGRSILTATHLRREAERADRLAVLSQGCITAIHSRGDPGFDATLATLRPD
ncbi:MAG: ATP-binding cassette domain-containing protein [Rhodobacteraceae bacterium]|nr:ATP-binding cassette domain-containing protein [Paracoccaceae bacterium]